MIKRPVDFIYVFTTFKDVTRLEIITYKIYNLVPHFLFHHRVLCLYFYQLLSNEYLQKAHLLPP